MQNGPRRDELPEGYAPSEYIPFREYAPPQQYPGAAPAPGQGYANQYYASPPSMPTQPQTSFAPNIPPRKQSLAVRWIILGVIFVLLVAVASFLIIRYVNRSTPDKTLDAFCSALQQGDYQAAYAQFSPRLQQTVSETRFATTISQDKVTSCTHGSTDESGTSQTNTLKLVHVSNGVNKDIVTLIKDSNDNWKIDDIYKQT